MNMKKTKPVPKQFTLRSSKIRSIIAEHFGVDVSKVALRADISFATQSSQWVKAVVKMKELS